MKSKILGCLALIFFLLLFGMEGLLESGLGFGWGAALLLLSVILFGAGSPRRQSRPIGCAKSDIGIPRGTSFVQRALQAYYPKAGKTLGCELPRPARTRRMSMRLRIKDKKKVPRGTGIPTENKGNNTTYILDQKEGDVNDRSAVPVAAGVG